MTTTRTTPKTTAAASDSTSVGAATTREPPYKQDIRLDIPHEAWAPTGSDDDTTSRLLTAININGTWHHMEAYAVDDDDGGAVDPTFTSNVDGIYAVGEPDGCFETTTINGREYVLVVTPYC